MVNTYTPQAVRSQTFQMLLENALARLRAQGEIEVGRELVLKILEAEPAACAQARTVVTRVGENAFPITHYVIRMAHAAQA